VTIAVSSGPETPTPSDEGTGGDTNQDATTENGENGENQQQEGSSEQH
jgi:hypothetical protein